MLVYKYVRYSKYGLFSVTDPVFEYKLNVYTKAIMYNMYSGIYCYLKEFVQMVDRFTKRDFELIECSISPEDLIRVEDGRVGVFKGVTPLRIVPREENMNW